MVTSNYHVERTREIFDFIYGPDFFINIYGAEVSYDDSTIADELSSIEIFRKTFVGINKGDNRMILERLRESHPFYKGEIYDKI